MSDATHLLWVDLETTGADVNVDEIIEMYAFITPYEYEDWNLDYYIHFDGVFKPSEAAAFRMAGNPVVREMHLKTGLFDECLNSQWDQERIYHSFLSYIDKFVKEQPEPEKIKLQIAGSGVAAFDTPIIKRYCDTEFEVFFVHSSLDVGHFRRFLKIAGKESLAPTAQESKVHRAEEDILDHFKEAQNIVELVKTY